MANNAYREQWVFEKLKQLKSPTTVDILDVGAGSSPFRKIIEDLGYDYYSHDFNSYKPSESLPTNTGLQNQIWEYAKHNFICDILLIPEDKTFDLILCTEVFEHVPDPVRAMEKLTKLVKPGGFIVITVPFISLMHQAPYWFQSGLSPFWFNYWSEKNNLEVLELEVFGDYIDLSQQEGARLFSSILRFRGSSKIAQILMKVLLIFRGRIDKNLINAGGFGTVNVGVKPK
jgi:SAM-dependent methyltransferase